MAHEEFNGKKLFQSDIHDGDKYRQEYLDSINNFIEKRFAEGRSRREQFMPPEKLVADTEYYRNEYLKMIGFPFDLVSDDIPEVETTYVGEDDLSKLYRLSITVACDIKFYGILFVPHGITKAPLVIAQHGGGGTPESCSDMAGDNNYNFFTKRALERGFVVFCPSIMLWSLKVTGEKFITFDIAYDRHGIDRKLRRIGYAITGFEVFCIMRSIDYLSTLDYVDETKIGMMGLSYGGYFSMHTAAADTRIIAAYNAGAFNDRNTECFNDWGYDNASNTFYDAEVGALCAPRRLLIDVGKQDAVFNYVTSEPEAQRICKYYKAYGAEDNFRYNLWEGGHRFDENLQGFEYFFEALS